MQLPEFFFCQNLEFPGAGLVLSTREPYNIAKPQRFESNKELEFFLVKYNLLDKCGVVNNYNILLVWIGTLGNVYENIPLGQSVTPEVYADLVKMAEFYEREKVIGNEVRFKRYRRT